jgi:hypothetical protein
MENIENLYKSELVSKNSHLSTTIIKMFNKTIKLCYRAECSSCSLDYEGFVLDRNIGQWNNIFRTSDLGTILDNGESKWKYSEVEQRKLDIKYYNKAIEYVKILFK